jgi:hypothetical protein
MFLLHGSLFPLPLCGSALLGPKMGRRPEYGRFEEVDWQPKMT